MSLKRENRTSLFASSPELIDRIVTLGLTVREARGWYWHYVLMPWVSKGLLAIALGSALLASLLTPLGIYLDSSLTLHVVVQQVVFNAAGFLLAYGIDRLTLAASRVFKRIFRTYATMLKANFVVNKGGMMTFAVAALLIAYWYFPGNFNAAVSYAGFGVDQHLTFLVAGGLIFVGAAKLTSRMRQVASIMAGKAIGFLGTLLIIIPIQLYLTYPLSEQTQLGLVMVSLMLVIDMTLVPYWLYSYFGKGQT